MRRQNPETGWGLRFFLWLYWLFSGYGERYRRPLLWAALCTVYHRVHVVGDAPQRWQLKSHVDIPLDKPMGLASSCLL